jgi:hypothetical protein
VSECYDDWRVLLPFPHLFTLRPLLPPRRHRRHHVSDEERGRRGAQQWEGRGPHVVVFLIHVRLIVYEVVAPLLLRLLLCWPPLLLLRGHKTPNPRFRVSHPGERTTHWPT